MDFESMSKKDLIEYIKNINESNNGKYGLIWDKEKEPYYPINNDRNNQLYEKYKEYSQKDKKVIFGGRLGQYKYFDMDKIILETLKCVQEEFK